MKRGDKRTGQNNRIETPVHNNTLLNSLLNISTYQTNPELYRFLPEQNQHGGF